MVRVSDKMPTPEPSFDPANPDPSCSNVSYRLYNMGNHEPVGLMEFIETMEKAMGKKAIKNMKPMQAGDVKVTYAETDRLKNFAGFAPSTSLNLGITSFVKWFIDYKEQSVV